MSRWSKIRLLIWLSQWNKLLCLWRSTRLRWRKISLLFLKPASPALKTLLKRLLVQLRNLSYPSKTLRQKTSRDVLLASVLLFKNSELSSATTVLSTLLRPILKSLTMPISKLLTSITKPALSKMKLKNSMILNLFSICSAPTTNNLRTARTNLSHLRKCGTWLHWLITNLTPGNKLSGTKSTSIT